jgi:hypothetical protein
LGFHVVYYGFEFFALKIGAAWEVAHDCLVCCDGGGDGGRRWRSAAMVCALISRRIPAISKTNTIFAFEAIR